jgi:hypothetical protein
MKEKHRNANNWFLYVPYTNVLHKIYPYYQIKEHYLCTPLNFHGIRKSVMLYAYFQALNFYEKN